MANKVEERDHVSYTQLLFDSSLLAVLSIGFVGALGTNSVPAALPAIGNAFTVTTGQIGLIMTVFFLPTIGMNLVVGVLVDIYGRRRVVMPALFLFSVTGIAIFFVDSFSALLLLRGIQGVAFAGTLPLTATLVGDLYREAQGSTAQGLRGSVTGIANTLAPVLAGVLAVMNWRYPFSVFAFAFPVLAIVYWYYPEPVQSTAEDGAAELKTQLHDYWRSIRAQVNDQDLLILIFGGFALYVIKQSMKTYVPVFVVRELGASVSTGGVVLGAYGAVRVLIAPFAGVAIARVGRKYVLLSALSALVASTALIPFTESIQALIPAIGLFAIGEALFTPSLDSGVADLVDDEHRGGIMSGLAWLKSTGNMLSPAVVGILIVINGFIAGFGILVAIGVGYAVALFILCDRNVID